MSVLEPYLVRLLVQHAWASQCPTTRTSLQGWEGLADSIVGAITVFWMALLSDRAFQMTPTNWHGNSVRCAGAQRVRLPSDCLLL